EPHHGAGAGGGTASAPMRGRAPRSTEERGTASAPMRGRASRSAEERGAGEAKTNTSGNASAAGNAESKQPPPAVGEPPAASPLTRTADVEFSATGDPLSPMALAQELTRLRKDSELPARRRCFLAQCLRWHPDKNMEDIERATKMFQMLQEKKDWFLSQK
ncbi:unnamed protein product, partial [Polarella glacialis]